MLIDLTQHFVEILPHLAPTTLVVRAFDTDTFKGEVQWTPEFQPGEATPREEDLKADMIVPYESHGTVVIYDGPTGGYRDDTPSWQLEWKITRPGSYWIGSARWELPQPGKDRPSIKFRASQILISQGATKFDLVTELQGDPLEWGHARIHIADYNPSSAEPLPLSGEASGQPRSRWDRLDNL